LDRHKYKAHNDNKGAGDGDLTKTKQCAEKHKQKKSSQQINIHYLQTSECHINRMAIKKARNGINNKKIQELSRKQAA